MKAYLSTSQRRPLLLIIPLQLGINSGTSNKDKEESEKIKECQKKMIDKMNANGVPIGVALGFPRFTDYETNYLVIKYKTTKVYDDNGGNEDLDEEDE